MNKQELIKHFDELPYVSIHQMGKKSFIDLIEQLDEPQKPVVPQFVADWLEEGKKHCKDVFDLFDFDFTNEEVGNWFVQEKPFDLVARAWLDGYEVEKEPKYTVKFKATKQYLSNDELGIHFDPSFRSNFTKSDLEKLGLGWVFDCEGMEVEKVGK